MKWHFINFFFNEVCAFDVLSGDVCETQEHKDSLLRFLPEVLQFLLLHLGL